MARKSRNVFSATVVVLVRLHCLAFDPSFHRNTYMGNRNV